jgi:predicted transcriptional regulator
MTREVEAQHWEGIVLVFRIESSKEQNVMGMDVQAAFHAGFWANVCFMIFLHHIMYLVSLMAIMLVLLIIKMTSSSDAVFPPTHQRL